MSEILERRLEFLRLEARGFSLPEVVKILSEKYRMTERNIYYDAETRETWQPVLSQLFDLDKARLILVNRYDWLYRTASLSFQTASEAQKPIYLSKMVEITDRIVTILGVETVKEMQDKTKRTARIEKEMMENDALLGNSKLARPNF